MELDYNSFMMGVMTGLKLHRPPAGRKPPAPSGRYILTESGEQIITEYSSAEVTLYRIGQWVPYPEGNYYYPGYYRLTCRNSSGNYIPDEPRYYFYARFTDVQTSDPVMVLWVHSDISTSIGRYGADYTSDPDGGQVIHWNMSWDLTPGYSYQTYHDSIIYNYLEPSYYVPAPENGLIYEGSFYVDLPRFILSIGSQPMITEQEVT